MMALTHSDADICDSDADATAIAKHAPSVIVNAAAYTAVDKAESEADRAIQVNRDGAAVLAAEAAKANLPLIHISTDYVFDGSARVPYDEEHKVNPQGAYARSKEAGERAVRAAHGKHLILRTAWVYGPFGTNFVKTMLRLGAERDEIFASSTTRPGGRPRPAILPRRSSRSPKPRKILTSPTGAPIIIPHTAADTVTWHGFATMIFAEAETFGRKVPRVQPIATADFPTAAPRPAYSVLSTAKLEGIFGIKPRPLRASLKVTIERLLGRRDNS